MGSSIKKAFKKLAKFAVRTVTNPFKAVGQTLQGDFKSAAKTIADQTLSTMTGEGLVWRTSNNPVRKDAKVAEKEMKKRSEIYGRSVSSSSAKPAGLINQLRQGKGSGGGSYSDVAKNSLGGAAGKTGSFSGKTG